MVIRFALGGFPDFLTPGRYGHGLVETSKVSSVSDLLRMGRDELEQTLSDLNYFQHVVFRLSGENPFELVQHLKMHKLIGVFSNRAFTVSFWTMDSHHLGIREARAAPFFDHVFVAHRNYLDLFDGSRSSYLPCSYSLADSASTMGVVSASSKEATTQSGICAPFALYPWQIRNAKYLSALESAERLSIHPVFFGTIRGGSEHNQALISKILEHKVLVNFSLSDDLNMRNFEALALNRVLLTNKISDHDLLADFQSNIVFLSKDSKSFEVEIREALEIRQEDISQRFMSLHSIEVRVEAVIAKLTGLGPSRVRRDPPKADVLKIKTISCAEEILEISHSKEDLLARSGWLGLEALRRVALSGPSPARSLYFILQAWLGSLLVWAASESFGKSSTLRVLVRELQKKWGKCKKG